MRERLLAAFLGMTVLFLGLYGVPRAYILANQVESQQQRELRRVADVAAVAVSGRVRAGAPVGPAWLERFVGSGERVRYRPARGRATVAGQLQEGGAADVVVSAPVAAGGTVTLARAGEVVRGQVAQAILPLVLLGLFLMAASGVIAFVLARRLARPFQKLAELARDLGTGRFDLDVPPFRVPEAAAIGEALGASAAELDTLLRREREFASNASHQLRTPITALRLELEDLSMWPSTPPEVSEQLERALHELDRLSDTVTELLDMARGKRLESTETLDLVELADRTVERWRRLAEGRRLVADGPAGLRARLAPGPVAQVLDVLIDNAIKHGRGRVLVAARDAGTHLEVRVEDEGRRSFGAEVFRRRAQQAAGGGEGIGLTVAAELAESMGGHLRIDSDAEVTAFVLMLPRASDGAGGQPTAG